MTKSNYLIYAQPETKKDKRARKEQKKNNNQEFSKPTKESWWLHNTEYTEYH